MAKQYTGNDFEDFAYSLDPDQANQLYKHLGCQGPEWVDGPIEEGNVEEAENLEVIVNGKNIILTNSDIRMKVVLTPKGKPYFAEILHGRIIDETGGMEYDDFVLWQMRCNDPKA